MRQEQSESISLSSSSGDEIQDFSTLVTIPENPYSRPRLNLRGVLPTVPSSLKRARDDTPVTERRSKRARVEQEVELNPGFDFEQDELPPPRSPPGEYEEPIGPQFSIVPSRFWTFYLADFEGDLNLYQRAYWGMLENLGVEMIAEPDENILFVHSEYSFPYECTQITANISSRAKFSMQYYEHYLRRVRYAHNPVNNEYLSLHQNTNFVASNTFFSPEWWVPPYPESAIQDFNSIQDLRNVNENIRDVGDPLRITPSVNIRRLSRVCAPVSHPFRFSTAIGFPDKEGYYMKRDITPVQRKLNQYPYNRLSRFDYIILRHQCSLINQLSFDMTFYERGEGMIHTYVGLVWMSCDPTEHAETFRSVNTLAPIFHLKTHPSKDPLPVRNLSNSEEMDMVQSVVLLSQRLQRPHVFKPITEFFTGGVESFSYKTRDFFQASFSYDVIGSLEIRDFALAKQAAVTALLASISYFYEHPTISAVRFPWFTSDQTTSITISLHMAMDVRATIVGDPYTSKFSTAPVRIPWPDIYPIINSYFSPQKFTSIERYRRYTAIHFALVELIGERLLTSIEQWNMMRVPTLDPDSHLTAQLGDKWLDKVFISGDPRRDPAEHRDLPVSFHLGGINLTVHSNVHMFARSIGAVRVVPRDRDTITMNSADPEFRPFNFQESELNAEAFTGRLSATRIRPLQTFLYEHFRDEIERIINVTPIPEGMSLDIARRIVFERLKIKNSARYSEDAPPRFGSHSGIHPDQSNVQLASRPEAYDDFFRRFEYLDTAATKYLLSRGKEREEMYAFFETPQGAIPPEANNEGFIIIQQRPDRLEEVPLPWSYNRQWEIQREGAPPDLEGEMIELNANLLLPLPIPEMIPHAYVDRNTGQIARVQVPFRPFIPFLPDVPNEEDFIDMLREEDPVEEEEVLLLDEDEMPNPWFIDEDFLPDFARD